MKATPITACANCQRLQVQLDALQARVDALQAQLATARKDSSTSSKPPSSDIVRPPKPHPPSDQPKRQPGGQPGHPKYERSLLPPEQLQASHDYYLELCPTCGLDLVPSGAEPRRIQQIEIATVPLHVHEHRTHPAWCPRCQKIHYAPLPAVVQHGGLAGPRLTTLIAFLKGGCHASFSTIRTFLREVVQVSISRGQLAKIIDRVSQALEQPYEQLLQALPDQPLLNVDETGHKDNGERMWTWCFRASLYTVFKIDPTRSADVLIEVLGTEFQGVLGCDYFSAYRRYMREFNVVLQFCLAHFIRDVKFLATLPDARDRDYGEKLCGALRDLFAVIHCREKVSPEAFARQLEAARAVVLRCGTRQVPATKHSGNLAKRLEKYGESYFRFITTPGVEPTNNLAEQAIRFVVIDRLITQGTRSEAGRRWCERIWTVTASCSQQGRSVFDYLFAAVNASFHQEPIPSLLPQE